MNINGFPSIGSIKSLRWQLNAKEKKKKQQIKSSIHFKFTTRKSIHILFSEEKIKKILTD